MTILESVPSLLAAVLDEARRLPGEAAALGGLRWAIPTGEALPAELARSWMELCPGTPLLNAYGPTECSDDVAHHRVLAGDLGLGPVPIGRPVINTRLYVLDAELEPMPCQASGEVWVGGAGVGRGYLGDPAKTAAAFRPDPFAGEPGARLYRTGDLAVRRGDGALLFLGRGDHQVKIRGVRIELGEIEAVLSAQPGVAQAVLVTQGEGAGRRLVGFVVPAPGAALGAEELRGTLAQRLPDAMVPGALEILDALPLTANGKIDRRALAGRQVTHAPAAPAAGRVLPRGPLEELVAGVWRDVLGVAEVGAHDNFFALGGHSLIAIQAVSRLQALAGAGVALRDLFEAPTVAELAARLETALGAEPALRSAGIVPRGEGAPAVLSFAQERLWFLDQLEADRAAFNVPVALRISGRLEVALLRRSLDEVARRHEALRTGFTVVDGLPQPTVGPPAGLPLPEVDLSACSATAQDRLLRTLEREILGRPFDLAVRGLVRAALLRLRRDEHVLFLTVHHLVSDGWSMGILIREVSALYRAFAAGAPAALPPLPIQYRDYAAWQRGLFEQGSLAAHLDYWRDHLAGAPPVLDLPGRRQRPGRRGGVARLAWPAALARELRAAAARDGSTLFMTLLAGLQTVIYRYTGQTDQILGTLVANRQTPETEGLIGFFVNALALRVDLSGRPGFRALLGRVRESTLGAFAHQDLPFDKLVAELNPDRDLDRTPLFQVMLVFQNGRLGRLEVPGVTLQPLPVEPESPPVDLYLDLFEDGEQVAGTVQYRADLYERPLIERFLDHYACALAAVARQPDLGLLDIPLLRDSEQQQLLREWNDRPAVPAAGLALPALFEEQVRRSPEALAVLSGGKAWSYRDLDLRSAFLARSLVVAGVAPEDLVAVLTARGLPLLTTILAIWKAGAVYLPLDPYHPAERHRQILVSARPRLLVYGADFGAGAGEALALLPPAGARPASPTRRPPAPPPGSATCGSRRPARITSLT